MGIGIAQAARAVFFDRDGVLNRAIVRDGRPHPPSSLADLQIEPAAGELLTRLKAAGFYIFVVSNQPDVARGTQRLDVVEKINRRLAQSLPVDAFYMCYHDDAHNCTCRKPSPGLLIRAGAEFGIALSSSYLVGDRWRDIDAGAAAGCTTILISRGYAERAPVHAPDFLVTSLQQAVEAIFTREAIDKR